MPPPAPDLLSFLASHDAPCPVCSYNLRGLQTDSCPECGAHLHLQVGSENLRLGPWLLGIISLALGAGFDTVVAILITGVLIIFGTRSPADLRQALTFLAVFAALSISCGTGILILIRRRRQWHLTGRTAQWRTAFAIFTVVFLVHAIVGALLARW